MKDNPPNFHDLEESWVEDPTGAAPEGDGEARELVGHNRSRAHVARYKCERCNGTGRVTFGYVNVRSGKCFKCNGRGYFKTSPHAREAARERARAKKAAAAKARSDEALAFLKNRPDVADWFRRKTDAGNGFAMSLQTKLFEYGRLTDNQLAAIERDLAKEREPKPERKPDADVSGAGFDRLLAGFDAARASALKWPKLTVGDVVFSIAGDASRNPGHLYVKRGGAYLGKISPEGKFYGGRDCDNEDRELVERIGRDPLGEAVASGKRTGRCSCCGRELTNEESIEAGIGPICRSRWGW